MNRSENPGKSKERQSRLITLLSQQKDLVYFQILEARNSENLNEVKKLIETEKQLLKLMQAVRENDYLLMNNEDDQNNNPVIVTDNFQQIMY